MHRADRAIVDAIELSYIENGYMPTRGMFVDLTGTMRCGLAALAGPECHPNEIIVTLTRAGHLGMWLTGFQTGFDSAQPIEFFMYRMAQLMAIAEYSAAHDWKFADQWSRGFRAGYSCAKRVFSKAPIEVVPRRELVGV